MLGVGDSLAGLYTYAILATVIAIVVLSWLGRIAGRIGGEAAFQREAEG
jgi:VIT1/CCC1 family predicted Fe2+/Mn2+ transporter